MSTCCTGDSGFVCKNLWSLIVDSFISIENNGLLHWRPKGHKQIITIAVPAKYRLPARFPQLCHRLFHKNRVVVQGRASSNPHLREAAILGSCVPKPLNQTDASGVPRRYFEFVPTVEDLKRIVPYGARDSGKRRGQAGAIRRAARLR